ncbi:MAG TPA: NUDIX domain-containing protein [Cytophagales bacterium]|nr:NUDIX domain-containing protein [Cytophagales bacterium]
MNEVIADAFGNKLRLRVSGILVEQDRILLISHKSLSAAGILWAPPGGGLQYGEDVESCLVREFKEETNLDVKVGKLLFVNEYLSPPLHAVELFFEIDSYKGDLTIGRDPELPEDRQIIQGIRFVSFEEIAQRHQEEYHSMFAEIKSLQDLKKLVGYHKNVKSA